MPNILFTNKLKQAVGEVLYCGKLALRGCCALYPDCKTNLKKHTEALSACTNRQGETTVYMLSDHTVQTHYRDSTIASF